MAAQKDVLIERLKTPEETLQGLLEKLHQIGYNEDEIEKDSVFHILYNI